MIKVVLYTALLLLFGLTSDAQSVLKGKNSNLAVTIKLLDTSFASVDSVKFIMTITNSSTLTKRVLFDKPPKYYPWSTSVSLNRKSGQAVKVTPWAFLSSQLYVEDELTDFYRELKTGESTSHLYYLKNIVRFDTKDGSLSKGTYTMQLHYDMSPSNKITFALK